MYPNQLQHLMEIFLWPQKVGPGSEHLAQQELITTAQRERVVDPTLPDRHVFAVTEPSLTVYRPQQANGQSLVLAPGGGYARLALDIEGHDVAQYLSEHGYTVFILKYRLPDIEHQHKSWVALQDAQRAVQLVRHYAKQWQLDPNKIGVMGGSAGGHLMAMLSTRWQLDCQLEPQYRDEVSLHSARPDFSVLLYPVMSFGQAWSHQNSQQRLIGADASVQLLNEFSPEAWVTESTPPCFMVLADDDDSVLPINSVVYYQALKQYEIAAEMHIFSTSGHGFGIRFAEGSAKRWPNLLLDWLMIK